MQSFVMLRVGYARCHYADVTYMLFMLSAIMLSVVIFSGVMLRVVAPSLD
jgi:hypothetical protein